MLRGNGYWAGAFYTGTTSGTTERVVVYGKTYDEARDKLAKGQQQAPRQALEIQLARQASYRADMGTAWPTVDLVFTTRTGRPVEPRNLVRSFRRICDDNNIRVIAVHHVRHTVASLLKVLGVPARDAQIILGHSRLAVTLEIYTHADDEAKLDALTRLHDLLDRAQS